MLKPLQGKELGVVNLYFKILMHHISVYISQRIYVVSGSRLGLIASGDSFASITPFTGAISNAAATLQTLEYAPPQWIGDVAAHELEAIKKELARQNRLAHKQVYSKILSWNTYSTGVASWQRQLLR